MSDKLTVERDPEVKVVTVIQVTFLRGTGSMGSVLRRVTQFLDFEGNVLGELDPAQESEPKPSSAPGGVWREGIKDCEHYWMAPDPTSTSGLWICNRCGAQQPSRRVHG